MTDYLNSFLKSREAIGVSPRTLQFYRDRLLKYFSNTNCVNISRDRIHEMLNAIPPNRNGLATRHATYRALKTFYRWLNSEYGIVNPMTGMKAPILTINILPVLDENHVRLLLNSADNIRDKAIISLFIQSGLRLNELANIKLADINWNGGYIKILGKGRIEAYAPFGDVSAGYLKHWLSKCPTSGNNIWNLSSYGICSMLRRLEHKTGLTCNPHTFRRSFAVILRKNGVDTMNIKELGRWSGLEMVQRYTIAFGFYESMKFYKPPLRVELE